MNWVALIFEFWWLWAFLIALLLYSRGSLNVMWFEAFIFIILIYIIQHYLFPDHLYFLIAIPIFVIVWWAVIMYILRSRNIYVLETTIQNETFKDIEKMDIHVSPSTSNRLLVMDEKVYAEKRHVGDASFPFWSGSDRLKFCDKYIDKEGIFFHPQLPQMKNVTIHTARLFLLKMKDDMPRLIRENVMLTWLSAYKTGHELNIMRENFELNLKAFKNQYEHEPFTMPDDLDELFEKKWLEAQKVAKVYEELKIGQPDKEVKTETKSEGDSHEVV